MVVIARVMWAIMMVVMAVVGRVLRVVVVMEVVVFVGGGCGSGVVVVEVVVVLVLVLVLGVVVVLGAVLVVVCSRGVWCRSVVLALVLRCLACARRGKLLRCSVWWWQRENDKVKGEGDLHGQHSDKAIERRLT